MEESVRNSVYVCLTESKLLCTAENNATCKSTVFQFQRREQVKRKQGKEVYSVWFGELNLYHSTPAFDNWAPVSDLLVMGA